MSVCKLLCKQSTLLCQRTNTYDTRDQGSSDLIKNINILQMIVHRAKKHRITYSSYTFKD